MRLEGKSAVVTGGGAGIGKAIVDRFTREGANVVVADIRADVARETARNVEGPGEAVPLEVDVAEEADAEHAMTTAVEEFGGLDVLVNNAGWGVTAPVDELTLSDWRRVIDVNLTGAFLCTKHAVPAMGSGAIVNIASIEGQGGWISGAAAYGASKGGLIAFTRQVAVDLAPEDIRVNAISPGIIETRLSEPLLADDRDEERAYERTPRGRLGTPEDVAPAAVFLASDEADFVVGETLNVDGGWRAK